MEKEIKDLIFLGRLYTQSVAKGIVETLDGEPIYTLDIARNTMVEKHLFHKKENRDKAFEQVMEILNK